MCTHYAHPEAQLHTNSYPAHAKMKDARTCKLVYAERTLMLLCVLQVAPACMPWARVLR